MVSQRLFPWPPESLASRDSPVVAVAVDAEGIPAWAQYTVGGIIGGNLNSLGDRLDEIEHIDPNRVEAAQWRIERVENRTATEGPDAQRRPSEKTCRKLCHRG